MEWIVEVVNVKKIYRMGRVEVPALNGVNLKVKRGEFMSVMGSSGSGKTTLLNLIGALDRPTAGKVFIKGVDISRLNDNELAELRNREIGFVFQFFNLIPRMTALGTSHGLCWSSTQGKEEKGKGTPRNSWVGR